MSDVAVLGSGAFGTALALALSHGKQETVLWGRDHEVLEEVQSQRTSPKLPGILFDRDVACVADLKSVNADTLLLAIPTQKLSGFLNENASQLSGKTLVACCKGIDLASGKSPSQVISSCVPDAAVAVLTGPSFASDIARGLPTALTLACADPARIETLQTMLSTPTLRLYRTSDVTGAELGGALKNVIAIACGVVIGAGLGESARAALMTRGFAEIRRLGTAMGAQPETLMGLSGMGDLVLTCSSETSRNFAFGLSVGRGGNVTARGTVEGVPTAHAALALATEHGVDMPITAMVSAVIKGKLTLDEASKALLTRGLKEE